MAWISGRADNATMNPLFWIVSYVNAVWCAVWGMMLQAVSSGPAIIVVRLK
ncbi:MAG: hypothetical protein V7711_00825 [Pseudomonadales bacterium]